MNDDDVKDTSLGEKIQKPSIIITSGGRTGTQFFKKLYSEVVSDCISLHEPENIDLRDFSNLRYVVKNFGLFNPTLNKLRGKWGITSISNRYMNQEIDYTHASTLLLQERKRFVETSNASLFAESSYHYYGLIGILPNIFKRHKCIYITRDGRDWVRSHMNKKEWYTTSSFHTIFGTRISPTSEDEYYSKWKKMTRLEKLCWAWVRINEFAINSVEKNPDSRFYRYEDIFLSEDKYKHLADIMQFTTRFKDVEFKYSSIDGKLEKKVNKPPTYDFPKFKDWDEKDKERFNGICGELMNELGYS